MQSSSLPTTVNPSDTTIVYSNSNSRSHPNNTNSRSTTHPSTRNSPQTTAYGTRSRSQVVSPPVGRMSTSATTSSGNPQSPTVGNATASIPVASANNTNTTSTSNNSVSFPPPLINFLSSLNHSQLLSLIPLYSDLYRETEHLKTEIDELKTQFNGDGGRGGSSSRGGTQFLSSHSSTEVQSLRSQLTRERETRTRLESDLERVKAEKDQWGKEVRRRVWAWVEGGEEWIRRGRGMMEEMEGASVGGMLQQQQQKTPHHQGGSGGGDVSHRKSHSLSYIPIDPTMTGESNIDPSFSSNLDDENHQHGAEELPPPIGIGEQQQPTVGIGNSNSNNNYSAIAVVPSTSQSQSQSNQNSRGVAWPENGDPTSPFNLAHQELKSSDYPLVTNWARTQLEKALNAAKKEKWLAFERPDGSLISPDDYKSVRSRARDVFKKYLDLTDLDKTWKFQNAEARKRCLYELEDEFDYLRLCKGNAKGIWIMSSVFQNHQKGAREMLRGGKGVKDEPNDGMVASNVRIMHEPGKGGEGGNGDENGGDVTMGDITMQEIQDVQNGFGEIVDREAEEELQHSQVLQGDPLGEQETGVSIPIESEERSSSQQKNMSIPFGATHSYLNPNRSRSPSSAVNQRRSTIHPSVSMFSTSSPLFSTDPSGDSPGTSASKRRKHDDIEIEAADIDDAVSAEEMVDAEGEEDLETWQSGGQEGGGGEQQSNGGTKGAAITFKFPAGRGMTMVKERGTGRPRGRPPKRGRI